MIKFNSLKSKLPGRSVFAVSVTDVSKELPKSVQKSLSSRPIGEIPPPKPNVAIKNINKFSKQK